MESLGDTSAIEIRLLGRFSVRRSGEEIPPGAFGGRLVRKLTRVLATRRGNFVSRDILAETLWPSRMPADPTANLKVLVNRARTALGDRSIILTGPGGYSLAAGSGCFVDSEVVLAAVEAGHACLVAGRTAAALRQYGVALDSWGGEPLAEDAYEDWAQEYRDRCARAYLQALEEGARAALAVRDPAQAVALAELAVDREPLREHSHLLLAEALAAAGDAAAALRTIGNLRRRLGEDLGLEPSPEASALETRIIRGEPLGPTHGRPVVVAPAPAFDELPFVGREQELEAVLGALRGVAPRRVRISGPAGAGKSRLVAEVATTSAVPVLSVRAFPGEQDEPWGLGRSLLREALALDLGAAHGLTDRMASALADVLPELEELRPIPALPIDLESRRALALEGGVRLLDVAASGGALLVVDDLQWADATSLALLGLVARRVQEAGLVVAYRDEDLPADGPVPTFLAGLSRQTVVDVALGSLPAEALSRLVGEEDVAVVLCEETDGTPLAVAEVLWVLAGRGVLAPDEQGRWRSRREGAAELAKEVARAGQRRAVQARVDRQRPGPRATVALLALVGREVPARVLAAARATDQRQVLDDLDALARSGLVRLGDAGWATAHDLIGESVAECLDREERGRFHQHLAQALEADSADAAEVARHLAAAGDKGGAATALASAARERLARFAGEESRALADAGLALAPESAARSLLLDTRAGARALRGDLAGAREDLQALLEKAEPGAGRSRFLARLALISPVAEGYGKASEIAEMALTEAGKDPAARAEALAVAAILDVNTNRMARAEARSAEALALFEQLGDARGAAGALDAKAVAVLEQGRLAEATELLDKVARLYRDSGQLLKVGTPRGIRAVVLTWMGRGQEAEADVEEALALERALGQREGEALILYLHSVVLTAVGRIEEARREGAAALALNEELGHREGMAESLLALALANEAAGDWKEADVAARKALDLSEGMPLVASRAAARVASLAMDRGNVAAAEAYAVRCLGYGVPLSDYEAQLVLAEVAYAKGDADAETRGAGALVLCTANGWLVSPARQRLERLVSAKGSIAPLLRRHRERRTFMFTDIVGSTRLVETLGDEAWDDLLRWHDQTLRSLFAAHAGEEVNRIGDGFFVAFDRARAAVDCAIAIQTALSSHRREHGFSPSVRIGLHHAEATLKEGDYQGRGVHEAARISALAAGGEILASRSVVDHLDEIETSEPRLVPLRGLAKPVEVVSINWH